MYYIFIHINTISSVLTRSRILFFRVALCVKRYDSSLSFFSFCIRKAYETCAVTCARVRPRIYLHYGSKLNAQTPTPPSRARASPASSGVCALNGKQLNARNLIILYTPLCNTTTHPARISATRDRVRERESESVGICMCKITRV